MAQEIRVEKVADNLVFPEGPVWVSEGFLLFSDVHGKTIEKLLPGGGTETWFSQGKKTNGLILSNDGKRIYACCYSERELLEIDLQTRNYRVLTRSCGGREYNNVNDVAIDAEGNVYFTDPKWGAGPEDVQGVYCHHADGTTTLAAQMTHQPNGIIVTPDQKWVFVTRSGAKDIRRYRLESGGKLVDEALFANLEAEPDGMTIDRKGNLYVALAGNGTICVLSPEAQVLHRIQVVDRMTTNCEFEGGNESVLYVTCGGRDGARLGSVYKITFPPQ